MRKFLFSAAVLFGLAAQTFAEVNVGADVVSRYLWRGQNVSSMAVQPSINYSTGTIGIGYWGSQAINGSHTENNLVITLDAGPVGLTITDYTSDAIEIFSVGDHVIEVMGTFDMGDLSISAAIHALNANEDLWVQVDYGLGEIGDSDVSLSLGLGNESYAAGEGMRMPLLGVNASNDDYFASYRINVHTRTNAAFIGKSF